MFMCIYVVIILLFLLHEIVDGMNGKICAYHIFTTKRLPREFSVWARAEGEMVGGSWVSVISFRPFAADRNYRRASEGGRKGRQRRKRIR